MFKIKSTYILLLATILNCMLWKTGHSQEITNTNIQGGDGGNGLDLKLVQMLYRHGDRNPIDPYPNDPYKNESFWPEGFGQLTKIGKMQQYELGKYIKERYEGYLSPSYNPYEILVQSSSVDRAITSAESNLAGMYPPEDSIELWNPEIKWNPIPVHSIPIEIDNKLKLSAPCPRYDQISQEFQDSPFMKKMNEENKATYDYLTEKSGRKIVNPQDVDYLFDTIHIEDIHKYPLPDWTKNVYNTDELKAIIEFSFKMLTYTQEMQRLKGGPLLKEMIENMNQRIKGQLDVKRKAFVYSAHDTTVSALLNTLDLFEPHIIPYAVLVMVNLYQNPSDQQYYISIEYRNDTKVEPYKLTVPNCSNPCKFDKFVELTKPKIPDNWEKECRASIASYFYDMIGLGMGALLLGTCLLTVVFLTIAIRSCLRRKRLEKVKSVPQYPYLHLQMDDENENEEA